MPHSTLSTLTHGSAHQFPWVTGSACADSRSWTDGDPLDGGTKQSERGQGLVPVAGGGRSAALGVLRAPHCSGVDGAGCRPWKRPSLVSWGTERARCLERAGHTGLRLCLLRPGSPSAPPQALHTSALRATPRGMGQEARTRPHNRAPTQATRPRAVLSTLRKDEGHPGCGLL